MEYKQKVQQVAPKWVPDGRACCSIVLSRKKDDGRCRDQTAQGGQPWKGLVKYLWKCLRFCCPCELQEIEKSYSWGRLKKAYDLYLESFLPLSGQSRSYTGKCDTGVRNYLRSMDDVAVSNHS